MEKSYSVSFSKFLITSWPTLLLLLFPIIIGDFDFNIAIFFILLLAVPGIIIFINHYILNFNVSIHFHDQHDNFIIVKGDEKFLLNKKDVIRLFHYQPFGKRAPWSTFESTKIIMKDGKKFQISNLVISFYDFYNEFGHLKIEDRYFQFDIQCYSVKLN